uniref:Zinc finger, CCHC-type n=1 Tax=Tanacetum cinerariifolium TaxID=118510 RepID=A0A6L2LPS5_TANCI|nr:hypothetical protein [Tanacetum cinerariifolium]
MYVIEQPLLAALAADSATNVLAEWNAIYDAYNEVACLILGSMTPEHHRQFENSSPYDMMKELKYMFKKQAGIKGYVNQLERLGYMLTQDLIVGLILNGLIKDFVGFVRIYNMHNMGKTIGEPHAMLIEYEKGLPKKAETQKRSKLVLPVLQGFREARKLKQGALYLYVGNGVRAQVEEIGSFDLVLSNGLVICLDIFSKNNVFYFNAIPSNGISEINMHGKMTSKSFPHRPERASDLLGIIHVETRRGVE